MRMNSGFNSNLARFAAVELEGREEVYVFDRLDPPSGKQAECSFGECLDAHHAGQNRSAVNLMIMKERLSRRVESGSTV